jgi:hypothetical protein
MQYIRSLARTHTAAVHTIRYTPHQFASGRRKFIYLPDSWVSEFALSNCTMRDPLFHERRYYFIYGSGKHVLWVSLF